MTQHYDVLVIGSGGGTKLVSPVAKLGKKVAIIEKDKLGGTCLNRGCIPSKMLIHVADIITEIQEAAKHQIHVDGSPSIDFAKLTERVANTIDKESTSIAPGYDRNPNIELIRGNARFRSNTEVEVNGSLYTADKIFITTGAKPQIPQIPGLDTVDYLTYKNAMRIKELPKRLIVIGGGYIAVELGYFFAQMGSEVQFVVRSKFLKQEDIHVQQHFEDIFTQKFSSHVGVTTERIEKIEDGTIRVHVKDAENNAYVIEADQILLATGVVPDTDELNLETTDVVLNSAGWVQVDPYFKTDARGVWAFGDCVGHHLFRHAANYQGEMLFSQLFGGVPETPVDYRCMPHAVFSNPQIGSIGKTEQQLIEEGIDYFVGACPYSKSAMGMALQSQEGFVKLLFDAKNEELIGAHIIGKEASNMIHMCIAFLQMRATLTDMLQTIYIHPALPELVRNAARSAKTQLAARK